ncbi:histidine kinase [Stenomitos frigidus]|uniref:Histidine kinase n=1 Tax=Stenomitos frigidus ULC18 TaxID=2107698 RepID=A0A2T1DU17_9CYAN|nr:histidine kinase [Stenomitos frigidus]PSB23980.1 histidine kinase [Stenomitos frigidus ULC18]
MSTPVKDKLSTELKQVKEVGKLRSDRIRAILRAAVSQVTAEFKEGSGDFRSIVKDVFSSAITGLQESGKETKDEIAASIEGIVDGISSARQQKIAETEAEVKRLQTKLSAQQEALEQEITTGLEGVQEAANTAPDKVKALVEEAIATVQNSEEASLLKKRYAQLQAQAAILRATLAARSESYYDQAQEHLDDAKHWYSKARPKAEAAKGQADQKFAQLEQQIGEAGAALARREREVRNLLSALLRRASETVREEDDTPDRPTPQLPPAPRDRIEP